MATFADTFAAGEEAGGVMCYPLRAINIAQLERRYKVEVRSQFIDLAMAENHMSKRYAEIMRQSDRVARAVTGADPAFMEDVAATLWGLALIVELGTRGAVKGDDVYSMIDNGEESKVAAIAACITRLTRLDEVDPTPAATGPEPTPPSE